MDSDDNCLVIDDNYMVTDEWNEDMEVSSTTPSKTVSPARRSDEDIENAQENEADSSMSLTLPTTEDASANDPFPKTSTPMPKQKERHEKRKSKGERQKLLLTNNEKKRISNKKAHSIRLTEDALKKNILNVSF